MHRCEHEVAGLGSSHRCRHGGMIAHFTHEDDINVFTKSGDEGIGKALGVDADLALVDDRLFRLKNVLDGVLDSNDVFHPLGIDEIDECRERGRFPLAHRADHDKKSLAAPRKGEKSLRKRELGDRANLLGDEPECNAYGAALVKSIATKANTLFGLIRKINGKIFLETCQLIVLEEHF